ncbi:MAG: preprotein translocase subunit SecG [Betaproteobacteria bacterium]|nr:preprotein translocase subunit SecG [Betaproteobacteria bacterium]
MNDILFPLVLTVHVMVGITVIGLVLIQHGKGADMGAAFGGGASGSLFGASGSANFMSRTTGVLAAIFFLTSLSLSYMATNRTKAPVSVMDSVKTQSAPSTQSAPAVPTPSTLPATSGAPAKTEAPLATPAANDSKAKDIPK